ncbi:MAG TPA: cytochrome c maturation protein CcmE, partial [Thermoanaerobaculia bacterium]|nr:cytochrome c maturation protein CcmE [Thermoanaerobaculia bacterium]
MNRRRTYVLGAALLVAFAGFAFASFRTALNQYVSFDQAVKAGGGVQVAGALEKGTSTYDETEGALHFTLKEPDTGRTLRIRYHGVKPGNFEDAVSVVAIGRYDAAHQELDAEKL